jgi:predicted component of viral defense system (DUF524 family)
MENLKSIIIDLNYLKSGLKLILDERKENTLFDAVENWEENGEAQYQLREGCTYEYEFTDSTCYFNKSDYIFPNIRNKHRGTISPNNYVGTLGFDVYENDINTALGKFKLEVQSVKLSYRSDYKHMLNFIAERCTDLVLQVDSPITQNIETDFNVESQTLYQRFCFVKSLIDSIEFEEAILKIISAPTTKWKEINEEKDIRSIRRFNQKNVRELVAKSNRIHFEGNQFLREQVNLSSLPLKVNSNRKIESIDTVENRFIKYALEEFLLFCEKCESKFNGNSASKTEASLIVFKLSSFLHQSFFKQISRPSSLKLNSPVLQRKSGYREVLHAWLKFDLAAKLVWRGGDNIYEAGKKDVAVLYEYWLFFTLLDILKEVFEINPKSIENLVQFDKSKISVNLKQGNFIALDGVFNSPIRKLRIQFSYNRSFGGGQAYPNPGSYTTTLRPDYTLSIWPADIIEADKIEREELITHIHFDAKYKVENFSVLVTNSKENEISKEEEDKLLEEEAEEGKTGNFKNQDLLKMHAYKDAIRRSAGAYILYPGVGKDQPFKGFHELIPGLGAFIMKPNGESENREKLKSFIKLVVDNFIDRTSQREYSAIKLIDIHKNKRDSNNVLRNPLPEYIDSIKKVKLLPHEIYVLVGYYKNEKHLEWILENEMYNVRYGGEKYELSANAVGARYLLLYSKDQLDSNKLFKLEDKGPKIYSALELKNVLKYRTEPSHPMYLVYNLEKVEKEFDGLRIDLSKLIKLQADKRPKAINLVEFLNCKIGQNNLA